MSHDISDTVVSEVATRAMLRAVLKYVERDNPTAHAWIDREMRKAAKDMVSDDDPEFCRMIQDRAAILFYR